MGPGGYQGQLGEGGIVLQTLSWSSLTSRAGGNFGCHRMQEGYKVIRDRPEEGYEDEPYDEWLWAFGLFSLKKRRQKGDLTAVTTFS